MEIDPDLGDYQSGFLLSDSSTTRVNPAQPTTPQDCDLATVNAVVVGINAGSTAINTDEVNSIGQLLHSPLSSSRKGVKLGQADLAMARLYQLCDNAGCPRYLGDKIIDLLKEEATYGFKLDDPEIRRRDAIMGRLQTASKIPYPEEIPVTLESGAKVIVYRFPFQDSLQRHLLGHTYANLDNLHVDKENPWSNLCNHPTSLLEVHDGAWYKATSEAHDANQDDSDDYLLHPILLYIDKTGTDKIDKNSLEPLMATSTLLKGKEREKSWNWFPLGLIPSPSSKSSAQKQLEKGQQSKKSLSNRDYHQCLEVLLEPMKELQQTNPIMEFRRGEYLCSYRIRCPVAGVVGDNLATDLLCGRRGNRTPTAARLSRRCLTTFQKADETTHVCNHVPSDLIHMLCLGALGCEYGQPTGDADVIVPSTIPQSLSFEKWRRHLRSLPTTSEKLLKSFLPHRKKVCEMVLSHVFSAHPIYNAFHGVDFGATKEGIHRATMSDILHTIEEGVVPKLLEVFFGRMGPQQLSVIDNCVQELFSQRSNRSGERGDYPRVSFTRGYSRLTLLSADERVGQLFVLSLLLRMEKGVEVLSSRFEVDFDERRAMAARRFAGETERDPPTQEGSTAAAELSSQPNMPSGPPRVSEPARVGYDDATLQEFLQAMDLSYIWNDLLPVLNTDHKKILKTTLQNALKPQWEKHLESLSVPHGYMDYQRRLDVELLDRMDGNRVHPTTTIVHGTKTRERVEIEAGREKCSIRLNVRQFTFLCELILSFHSLLKYGNKRMGCTEVQENYQTSFELMKELLTKGITRGEGTREWHIQKFLEMNHFLADMMDYGTSGGYSTSTGERGLKEWAKKPARTAQKRSDEIFSKQVCLRIHDTSLFTSVLADTVSPPEALDNLEQTPNLSRKSFGRNFLYAKENNDARGHVWRVGRNRKRVQRIVEYPDVIVNWFDKHIPPEVAQQEGVRIFTELSIFERRPGETKPTKIILRAHHDYQGGGPWNDFVLIDYGSIGRFPCKVVCFFIDPVNGEEQALVQECTSYRALEDCSLISSKWRLASSRRGNNRVPSLQSLSTETISDRIYAIETSARGLTYRTGTEHFDFLWVKYSKEDWGENFLSAHNEYTTQRINLP